MGVVYLGMSRAGEQAAVKQIHGRLLDTEGRRRFHAEIEASKLVWGARIAPFIDGDSDPDDGDPWLAVKYIPGPTLDAHVEEHGPLDTVLVAILGAALAEGLASIHQTGLLHRDLKPRNVILGNDGPFVIDFGLALLAETKVNRADRSRITASGHFVGTLVCMPPEQVAAEKDLTTAADVHALGATLLYAATGHYPYDAADSVALMTRIASPSVPPDLTGLPTDLAPAIGAMLANDAGERPTLGEITEQLVRVVESVGFTAHRARVLLRRATAADAWPSDVDEQPAEPSNGQQPARPATPSRQGSRGRNSSPPGAIRAAQRLRASYARDASF